MYARIFYVNMHLFRKQVDIYFEATNSVFVCDPPIKKKKKKKKREVNYHYLNMYVMK
jgi:hypothetical protein